MLPRNRFDGKLHGKTINDFISKLDYNLTQEEKKKRLFEILDTQFDGQYMDEFFVQYYTQYFKAFLSKSDSLSSSNNISQALERMANYLMFSNDGKRISKKEMPNNFYTNSKLAQHTRQEIPLSSLVRNCSDEVDEDSDLMEFIPDDSYIDLVIQNSANYRLDDKQKIMAADLKDPELQSVVDYHKVLNSLKKQLQNMKDTNPELYRVKKWKYTKLMSELKMDEICAKEGIKRPIRLKAVMKGDCQPDYLCSEECYEDNGVDIIKAELQLANKELIFDSGIIKYDLNKVLTEIQLTDIERQVVNMVAFKGLTQQQIGNKLNISQQAVVKYLNRISQKVLEKYEEQIEEVVYTHGMKGKYKTCSKCKQNKLATERYFHKDSSKKDGLKYACKECEK